MSEQADKLSDFERGGLAMLRQYAWWKDGTQYVGCGYRTLRAAQVAFLEGDSVPVPDDLHEPRLREAVMAVLDGDWLADEAGTTSDGSTPVSDQLRAALAATERGAK